MKYFIFILIFLTNIYAYKVNLKDTTLYNQTAYISAQCYTKTIHEANQNIVSNPCYTCHSLNKAPNYTFDDTNLQEAYDFPEAALKNPFTNLFKDRTKEVAKISDTEILKYVKEDNYKDKNGEIILAKKLKNLPSEWDFNDNKKWDGYIPDCEFNFDSEGFDRKSDGTYTLWRAFAYYPFLGTFWPTNGSTDDVIIRLDKLFSLNESEKFDKEVYMINLLIVESLIKQRTVKTFLIDEKKYGVDLNQNGKLDSAKEIVFRWKKPTYDVKTQKISNFSMSYVGAAKEKLLQNKIQIAPGLYPINTEFLHSVRYIDVDTKGKIKLANRMKELRYAKKFYWQTYNNLQDKGLDELKEKDDFPDRTDQFTGNIEQGINNKKGWYYQGFIEDEKGDLRPQSYEESVFCMGCHNNIGAIADSTFVFQRKFEHETFQHGWYHWGQKGLENIKDFVLKDGDGEYAKYLSLNNAGDEFRGNKEIMDKFFVKGWQKNSEKIEEELLLKLENPGAKIDQSWKLKPQAMKRLKDDISYLILPSPKRALSLNKAYKVIVNEQSFIYGRDATIKPSKNVFKEVNQTQSTGVVKYDYLY